MEKTISPEERMRRAEEIYYRRKLNTGSVRMPSSQVKDRNEKRQYSLYKKMAIQILTCILIYLVFSLIKEANYIFSENVLNKTREFLNSDINFEVMAGKVGQFFKDNQDKLSFLTKFLNDENNSQEQLQNTENKMQNEKIQNTQSQNNYNENSTNQNSTNDEGKNNQNNTNSENKNNTENGDSKTSNNTQTGIGGASTNEVVATTSSKGSSRRNTNANRCKLHKKEF